MGERDWGTWQRGFDDSDRLQVVDKELFSAGRCHIFATRSGVCGQLDGVMQQFNYGIAKHVDGRSDRGICRTSGSSRR